MSWLSEIEERTRLVLKVKLTPICRQDHMEKERMARVIREQNELIKLLNDASVFHYIQGICNLVTELEKAFDNLSSDSKELLR